MSIVAIVNPFKIEEHNEAEKLVERNKEILIEIRELKKEAEKFNDEVLDELILNAQIEAGCALTLATAGCRQTCWWHATDYML